MRFVNVNVAPFDAAKHAGLPLVATRARRSTRSGDALEGHRVAAAWEQRASAGRQPAWGARCATRGRHAAGGDAPARPRPRSSAPSTMPPASTGVVVCAAGSACPATCTSCGARAIPPARATTSSTATRAWATRSRAGWASSWPTPEREVFVLDRRRLLPDAARRAGHRGRGADSDHRRAGRQPWLRVDRRAVALGRLGGVRHPLPLRRRTARCRGTAQRRRAGRPGEAPGMLPLDLAANAESLGARVIRTDDDRAELREALAARAEADGPVVIYIETDRYAGVPGYEGWWDVPVAEVSDQHEVRGRPRRCTSAGAAAQRHLSGAAPMTDLLVQPASTPAADGTLLIVTPESAAGWSLCRLRGAGARRRGGRGNRDTRRPRAVHRRGLGDGRRSLRARRVARAGRPRRPLVGPPDAAYLPPGTAVRGHRGRRPARGGAVLGAGAARRRRPAARCPADEIDVETRGLRQPGAHHRPDPDGRPRGRVAAGVRGASPRRATGPATRRTSTTATTRPRETYLEETYYHRVVPGQGFGAAARLQRRPLARRDAHVRRSRLRAGPARLSHGLGAARVRPLLPQRDGRADAPVGRRQ